MYNVYNGKKFVASFERLRDARSYVTNVLISDYSRKGYDLIAVKFPRRRDPQHYTFGRFGSYVVVTIYPVIY